MAVPTTKLLGIRECGFDEYWLRDQICGDPAMLGLGELQPISKEQTQSQEGRLDLLLKDPEDESMFEVELQLGPTDETHIIRTIEYWANEKRRWSKRRHTAVLVAEEISKRFFNVVHLLSLAVPIIGIQSNMVQVGETRALHFNKVIDTYEEPEEAETSYDENYWIKNHPGNLECAKWYRALLEKLYGEVPAKYFEWHISLCVGGVERVSINRRKNNQAMITVKVGEDGLQQTVDHLNAIGISFTKQLSEKTVNFNVNLQQLKDNAETHAWLASTLSPENVKLRVSQQNA
ncbi:MAG TPA: hypothetical protein VEK33_19805 [Terriglobales bacterium]|nr:hypothetical protein [Terriglobales bacterium]